MTGPAARLAAALALGAAALTSCSQARPEPLPPPPHRITVTMDEYSFKHPATVPSGRVVFEVVNAGRRHHKLALVPLPDDFPPVAEQLKGADRRVVTPLAGVVPQAPGARTTFAVNLDRQRYGLFCFIVEPDADHPRLGMASEVRAR